MKYEMIMTIAVNDINLNSRDKRTIRRFEPMTSAIQVQSSDQLSALSSQLGAGHL